MTTAFAPKLRNCRPVELMFNPDSGNLPYAPDVDSDAPELSATAPESSHFKTSTPDGLAEYIEAVNRYVGEVESFELRVSNYGGEDMKGFATAVDDVLENAELPELFQTFTNADVHLEIERAGIITGDEVVVLLRGYYDRLVGDGSACVFDSRGVCIHRECGMTREEVVNG